MQVQVVLVFGIDAKNQRLRGEVLASKVENAFRSSKEEEEGLPITASRY